MIFELLEIIIMIANTLRHWWRATSCSGWTKPRWWEHFNSKDTSSTNIYDMYHCWRKCEALEVSVCWGLSLLFPTVHTKDLLLVELTWRQMMLALIFRASTLVYCLCTSFVCVFVCVCVFHCLCILSCIAERALIKDRGIFLCAQIRWNYLQSGPLVFNCAQSF